MLTIATWNINSVRLRLDQALRLLRETEVDVLCLQELKAATDKVPVMAFAEAGYPHAEIEGQPGYNGVGFFSKRPLERGQALKLAGKDDARHLEVFVPTETGDPIAMHGVYAPSGGDVPDREANEKFDHKLRYLEAMVDAFGTARRSVLMGDLNVAPLPTDVWSHKQMLGVVSHTPGEVARLEAAQAAGPWTDAARVFTPPETPLFSWWSYRARDWRASNRGRRLDHIWVSSDLAPALTDTQVLDHPRDWEKPSDHAPVVARLDV